MKMLTVMLLVAAPAAAQAMGMHGEMHHGCASGAVTHLAVGLYALLAALGYWILTHSAKETANYVKRTGQALSWTFIVIGLLGLLCGVASHAKMAASCKDSRDSGAGMMMQQPMEMGNMPKKHSECPMQGGMMKKPETATKTK